MPGGALVLVGLDGATLDLVEPWAEAGHLPTLAGLMDSGCYGKLRSTVPDTTPVAWPSIYTGTNPGKHGMFGFRMRVPGTYEWRHVTSGSMARSSFWELLGRDDHEIAVLFAPFTFPVRERTGWVVAGRGAPRRVTPEMSHPPELASELAERFGAAELFGEQIAPGASVREVADRLVASADQVGRAAAWVASQRSWDALFVTWDQTDTAAHLMWHHSDPNPDRDSLIFEVYRAVDSALGRFLDACAGDPTVIVCSDHGTQPSSQRVHLPLWLQQEGFLDLRSSASRSAMRRAIGVWKHLPGPVRSALRRGWVQRVPERAQQLLLHGREELIAWPETRVYPDPVVGSIAFVNELGREPAGTVREDEREGLLEEVTAGLLRLELPNGDRAVASVERGRDIYRGPLAHMGPDLAVHAAAGVEMAPVFVATEVMSSPRPPVWDDFPFGVGHHHPDGMIIVSGHGAKRGKTVSGDAVDIAPTIMRLMESPLPDDLDGSPIETAFERLPKASRRALEDPRRSTDDVHLTPEQEADVAQHLRELGYIE